MIKVSDYIAKRLKEKYNINNVFLISGGGAMHLNDSFGKYFDYITAHNEQALSMMAEGYARVNNDLAVVNVTTGPGGLNTLSGVFGQWTDSVPVLYISGQVKFETTMASCKELKLRQLGDQETDIISAVNHLTKYSIMVTDPNTIKYHLDKAVYIATNGRKGPVWLDIPINVQSAMIDETKLIDFVPEEKTENIDDSVFESLIDKLNNSKKPVIIAGYGIKLSKQEINFYELIQKLNIPVLSTFCGMDIMHSDNLLYAGRIGSVGQRAANIILTESDFVLCLGTRNSIFSVSYNYENFAKNAYKVCVDIDENELNKKTVKIDIPINMDLSYFIPKLLEKVNKLNIDEWVKKCKEYNVRFSFENTKEYNIKSSKINPYYFVRTLTELMREKDILVTGNGSACVITYQVAKVKAHQRIFWNKGCAAMGYGFPASIGACIKNNKNSVICLDGDGSFMMNLQELQTVKQFNLPLKIFIINNNGYISIKQTQNNFFEGHMVGSGTDSNVSMPDFNNIAKAFGIKSIEISSYTDNNDLKNQINMVLNTNEAVLCNVIVDDEYIFTPKLLARKLEDGTMISPSFENMYPFIEM